MALLRLELKNYNKATRAGGVRAYAHYLAPAVAIGAHALHNTGERLSERPRTDVVAVGHAHMPAWAQDAPSMAYWQAADRYSRKNACLGKEVLVSLPREFTHQQNLQLVAQFLRQLPQVPTSWAYHAPLTRSGRVQQPHCHFLLSPRPDDGRDRTPEQYFRRRDTGGVETLRLWTRPEAVRDLRAQWEGLLRSHLRARGLAHTVHRDHPSKERPLGWHGARQLQRALGDDYGQEGRLTADRIRHLWEHKALSRAQAVFCVQRAIRQLTHELRQEARRAHDLAEARSQVRWWQVPTRLHVHREQHTAREQARSMRRRLKGLEGLAQEIVAPVAERQQRRQYAREQHRQVREMQQREREYGLQQDRGHTRGRGMER